MEVWRNRQHKIVTSVFFLSVRIARMLDGSYRLDQRDYVHDILDRNEMAGATSITALQWPEEDTVKPTGVLDNLSEIMLTAQRLAGELLWLSQRTRPDLTFAVNASCASAVTRPEQSVIISKAVLRFL